MKKVFSLIFVFVLLLTSINYAGQWVEIPSTKDFIYLSDDLKPVRNQWIEDDADHDGKKEMFYFGLDGLMYKNKTTPDGKQVNQDGYYVIGNTIQKVENISNVYVQETTQALNLSNNLNSFAQSNVINAENAKSSAETNKYLKNNIAKKSGVEFVDTKKINGKSWVDLIRMNGNDSYIKSNCGNYDTLSFETGVVDLSSNGTYLLAIYINGELLGEYDDEYFNQEKIEFSFDPHSEIMITYSCQAEEGEYLSSDNKYLYLRNAKYSIKNN